MSEFPGVCANCAKAILLSDDGENLVPGLCTDSPTWVHIVDMRNHYCSRFEMLREPRFSVENTNRQSD